MFREGKMVKVKKQIQKSLACMLVTALVVGMNGVINVNEVSAKTKKVYKVTESVMEDYDGQGGLSSQTTVKHTYDKKGRETKSVETMKLFSEDGVSTETTVNKYSYWKNGNLKKEERITTGDGRNYKTITKYDKYGNEIYYENEYIYNYDEFGYAEKGVVNTKNTYKKKRLIKTEAIEENYYDGTLSGKYYIQGRDVEVNTYKYSGNNQIENAHKRTSYSLAESGDLKLYSISEGTMKNTFKKGKIRKTTDYYTTTYYDEEGNKLDDLYNYKLVSVFDKKGRQKSLVTYDNGEKSFVEKNKYKGNHLSKNTQTSYYDGGVSFAHEGVFYTSGKYKGLIKSSKDTDSDGVVSNTTYKYKVDKHGNVKTQTEYRGKIKIRSEKNKYKVFKEKTK